MENNKLLAEILLPLAFNESFSYRVPENLEVKIGDVVLVNFVNRNIHGVVTNIKEETEKSKFKIKNIISKDGDITISEPLLKLINFAANYNLAPKGLFLKLAISILNSSKNKEISEVSYQINKNLPENLKITEKRQKIIDIFKEKDEIDGKNLIELAQISSSTLNSLVKNEFLIKKTIKNTINPTKTQAIDINNFNLHQLSKNQEDAASFLKEKIAENQHNVILVDGVTGSGKTEIYFDAIAKILKEGSGQVLILLPEIILTDQLVKRFESRFNFKPDVWHSKINNNQKRDIFYGINNGDVKVLISTRSALFLPFDNLKLIIVDEEHESSFKQEDIVNYHGRDMAILRAKFEEIPIILSSATPSIETYVNVKNGKYNHLVLEDKFFNKDKAEVQIVDMKKDGVKGQYISNNLKDEIIKSISNNEQILLFLNRRGYAPVTLCKSCGDKVNCINCSSYVTYHQKINKLICHHCGYEARLENPCQSCEAQDSLVTLGAGVERIAEEVGNLFPDSRVALMTSDTLKNPDEIEKIIKQITDNEVDIIIGTQIIAKGHHFPNLALVGIIDGDSSFNNSNLRAAEKSFQLLTQVIGRAGREKHKARIILQSYNTQNLVFKYVANQNRNEFFDLEIQNRKAIGMPPFSKMIAIIFISKIEDVAINNAKMMLRKFPIQDNIEIFGPAPMPISRIRKHYYYRILVKSDKKLNIQKLVGQIIKSTKPPSNLRIKVDVDPI